MIKKSTRTIIIPSEVFRYIASAVAFYVAYLMGRDGIDYYGYVIFGAILIACF